MKRRSQSVAGFHHPQGHEAGSINATLGSWTGSLFSMTNASGFIGGTEAPALFVKFWLTTKPPPSDRMCDAGQ